MVRVRQSRTAPHATQKKTGPPWESRSLLLSDLCYFAAWGAVALASSFFSFSLAAIWICTRRLA
jgi:hypothetical protein